MTFDTRLIALLNPWIAQGAPGPAHVALEASGATYGPVVSLDFTQRLHANASSWGG